jgi:bifunctional non-homologous end joining protein LigD
VHSNPCTQAALRAGLVHEVKHDGYRLIVRRDGATVRLFTRRGYDWTDRYPAIATAAAKLRASSFTLDGEAVGTEGVAVFDAPVRFRPSGTQPRGPAARAPPCPQGKAARLLARKRAGIVFNEHTEEDGAVVSRHACKLGFEGIVSKRLTAPYRSGPSRDWIKVKNPDSPAVVRARARGDGDGCDRRALPGRPSAVWLRGAAGGSLCRSMQASGARSARGPAAKGWRASVDATQMSAMKAQGEGRFGNREGAAGFASCGAGFLLSNR